jgi:rhodanese-related sulfurtransferase
MFTGIITAMTLIFLTSGLGILDYNLIYVNETYLMPGIVGGLIMGAGFIIGGFCPGTSLVAAATFKIDGIMFALGAFFGIFLFGETVGAFESFWYSSYLGRFTLMDLFQTNAGVIVVGVMIMALVMFAGGEVLERVIGKRTDAQPRWRYGLAGGGLALAVAVLAIGQPTNTDKWNRIAAEKQPMIDTRAVYVHPGEVLHYINDHTIITMLIDVREESDYNQFHIQNARHVPPDQLPEIVAEFHALPENAVVFVMSNDETLATEAWRYLVAESVVNVYIIEGGVNHWLDIFGEQDFKTAATIESTSDEQLRYQFAMAYGARHPAASPHADRFELAYEPHVVLTIKRGPASGGCG